ncbi:magnesium/cobalt transporter CorA [Gracilimonas sediminicola]|uniref:Magnesium transport protein CorA n=1 Tax=Gracilimonas sediminicola TaxID=2952158 RepID=A0A9X2L1B0_9BACT|nr:magnesium/cobalt transporter CorA [Gracilimonas sediminicola]MCP9290420.1 magnesium/cobalt transporter CorA [Gracilimonas sediminicola]
MKKIKKRLLLPSFLRHNQSSKKPGQAPGTLLFTGEKRLDNVLMHLYDYDVEHLSEHDISEIDDSKPYLDSPSKTWINVCGLHDIEKLKEIWDYFNLHPLIQEDILHTQQRPKIEEYSEHMFFVLRMMSILDETGELKVEQVSIVLSQNSVLSFQEDDYPIYEPVLHRLRNAAPRLRKQGPDYLAYALIDTIVDHYMKVMEKIGNEIEELEDEILQKSDESIPEKIHALRRKLIFFRRSVWPLRDSLNSLLREESHLVHEENKIFFRDVYDHLVQIIDGIENYRDMAMGMLDMYMSQVSNKMNEVMKVLTIIATIFIPLTFIAGIYGMNFEYMPELGWKWAYPAVWGLMIVATMGMVVYFRKKDWL